jgi:hypothetical protein
MSEFTNKDIQEYAWNYFALHASQRMSLFNFFVACSSVVTAALCGTFYEKIKAYEIGIALGIMLPVISFVFWKLDQRVSFLIKHAEAALKHLECKFPSDEQQVTKLFALEESLTSQKKEKVLCWPIGCHMTYSCCFKIVFWTFAIIGMIGAGISFARLVN